MSVPPLPASRSGKVIQAPAIAVDPGVPGSWTGRSRSLIQGCPPSPAAEPYILERKVKWALGSITMNKTSGGDGIPAELFQILKDDSVKVLHSIYQQIWKPQQCPQDWKRSVFIPILKKGMPKNAQTTAQLHSSHMLAK